VAKDARIATVAASIVDNGKLLEDNWTQPLLYQRPGSSRTHGATTNDRNIKALYPRHGCPLDHPDR
jgi:hypothetical protein